MNSFLFNIGSRIERGNDIYVVEGYLKEITSYSLRSPSSGYVVSSPKIKVEREFNLVVEAAKRKLIPGISIAKKVEPLQKEITALKEALKKSVADRGVMSPDFVYIEKTERAGKGVPYYGKEGYDRLDYHIKQRKNEIQVLQDKLDDINYTLEAKSKWYTQAEDITNILNKILGTSFKDYDINDAVRGWRETSADFDARRKADPDASRIQNSDPTVAAFLADWIDVNKPTQDKLKELVNALKSYKDHPIANTVEKAIKEVEPSKVKPVEVDMTSYINEARKELEASKPLSKKRRDVRAILTLAQTYLTHDEARRPRNRKLDSSDVKVADSAVESLQKALDDKEATVESLNAALKKFNKELNELSYDVSNDLLLLLDRKTPKGEYTFSEAEVNSLAKKKWETAQPKEKKKIHPEEVSSEPITVDVAARVFIRYLRDNKDSGKPPVSIFNDWINILGKKEYKRLGLPWDKWSEDKEVEGWGAAHAAWEKKVKEIKKTLVQNFSLDIDTKPDWGDVKNLEVHWKKFEDTPASKGMPAVRRIAPQDERERDRDLWSRLHPIISDLISLVGNRATDAIIELVEEGIKGHENFDNFKADAQELVPSHLNPDRLPSLQETLEAKKKDLEDNSRVTEEQEILHKRQRITADIVALEKIIRKIKDLEGNLRALHTVWKGSMEKQSNLVKNISDNYRLVLGERELTLETEWLSASIKFSSIAAACKKFTELNTEADVESAFDVATLVAMEKEGMVKCLLCNAMVKEGTSDYRTLKGEICNKHTIKDIPVSMMKIAAAKSRCKTCGYAYVDDDKVAEHKAKGHTIVVEESSFTPASKIAPEVLKDIERSHLKEVVRRDLDWEKEFPQGLSEHKTPRGVADTIGEDNYLDGVITELQEHQSGDDNVYDKQEIFTAAKTAADHIQEDKNYYLKLRKMEEGMSKTAALLDFGGEKLSLQTEKYVSGGMALALVGEEGPYATVSVNLPEPPAAGCFWLKNWSENEGVAQALLDQGFIELTGNEQATGFVTAPEARLTPKGLGIQAALKAEVDKDLKALLQPTHLNGPDGGEKQQIADYLANKIGSRPLTSEAETKKLITQVININFPEWIEKNITDTVDIAWGVMRNQSNSPAGIPAEVGTEGNPAHGNANMDGTGTFIMPAGQPANQSANVMKEGAYDLPFRQDSQVFFLPHVEEQLRTNAELGDDAYNTAKRVIEEAIHKNDITAQSTEGEFAAAVDLLDGPATAIIHNNAKPDMATAKFGPDAAVVVSLFTEPKDALKTEAELGIIARIVKKPDGFHVYAETGRHMGGPYQSHMKAKERLQQIEMFKHMKGASMDFQVGDTAILNTRVGFLNEGTEVIITACVDKEVTFVSGDIHGITKAAHLDKASAVKEFDLSKEAAAELEKYPWDNDGLKNKFELGDRVKVGSVELGGMTYKDREGTIREKVIVSNTKDTEMFYMVEIDGCGTTTLPEDSIHKAKKATPQSWRTASLNEDEFVKKEAVLKPNFDVAQEFLDSYDHVPTVVTTDDIIAWLQDPKQNYQYSKKDLKQIVKYLQSARVEVRVPVEKDAPETIKEEEEVALEAPLAAAAAEAVPSLEGVKKEAVKIKDPKGTVTEITDPNHPMVKENLPVGSKITNTDGTQSEVVASKSCKLCQGEKAIICECMSDANIWLTASCAKCDDGGYVKCVCANESY